MKEYINKTKQPYGETMIESTLMVEDGDIQEGLRKAIDILVEEGVFPKKVEIETTVFEERDIDTGKVEFDIAREIGLSQEQVKDISDWAMDLGKKEGDNKLPIGALLNHEAAYHKLLDTIEDAKIKDMILEMMESEENINISQTP